MNVKAQAQEQTSLIIPFLFTFALLIPVYFSLGSIRLTPYRLILLAAFVPALTGWLTGRAGPVRGYDILILVSYSWAVLALCVNHGLETIEGAGILFIESITGYMLGRVFIRNSAHFMRFARILFAAVLILFPLAFFEAITGRPIAIEFFRKALPSFTILSQQPRMGMERAQVVFEHSILYGSFVATAYGPIHYIINSGKSIVFRAGTYAIGFWAAVFSVSGGALIAVFFQVGLFFWDRFTRFLPKRWTILALIFLAMYIVVDIASNRDPFNVFVSYLTFSPESAYNRILIWQFGTENVADNPIFGIGMGDWARPGWMGDSIDNFWLLLAMRYGLPMIFLFSFAILWIIRASALTPLTDPNAIAGRAAHLTMLGGMILAGFTVHYWNALFVWFMFILGSGAWVMNTAEPSEEETAEAQDNDEALSVKRQRAALPYSRPVPKKLATTAGEPSSPYGRRAHLNKRR